MKRIQLILLLCLLTACNQILKQSAPRTLQDGVFSTAQVERGAVIYKDNCEICHAADMRGGTGSRSIVGIEFKFLWKDKTLGQLLETVRMKMPPANPGVLTDQEYIDVLTTVLKANGFPSADDQELVADEDNLEELVMIWEEH